MVLTNGAIHEMFIPVAGWGASYRRVGGDLPVVPRQGVPGGGRPGRGLKRPAKRSLLTKVLPVGGFGSRTRHQLRDCRTGVDPDVLPRDESVAKLENVQDADAD